MIGGVPDSRADAELSSAWVYLGDARDARWSQPGSVAPLTVSGEPVILVRDGAGELRLLSNACTHRGKLVVDAPTRARELVCGYHGRAFGLDGCVLRAPGFEGVADFPDALDHLASLPLRRRGDRLFTSLVASGEAP